jgi:putative ABC transport system permease protein
MPLMIDALRQSRERFFSLFRGAAMDCEVDAEMATHLELAIEENLRSGMTPVEARRRALLHFGGVEQSKELYRDHRGYPFMETLLQDVKFGLRVLAKTPGFTLVAILTLALGIGANTGIFSVMQQVLLQRLPVPHPEQLVLLYAPGPKEGHVSSDEVDGSESFSYPMYKDLRDQTAAAGTVFAGLAAKASFHVSVASRGNTEHADAELVSGNYFDVLGVHPALGRTLQPADAAVEGGNPVIMLGYGYWQKRFGGDLRILNESVLVNNQTMTVVGVVQPGFNGIQLGRIPDVYIPITMKPFVTPGENGLSDHQDYWVKVFARLQPGISRTQAMAAIAPGYHSLLAFELPLNKGMNDKQKAAFLVKQIVLKSGARGRPMLENDTKQQLLTLMAMVGLVLLIACANVAALQTARGAARQKEIALRLSLGATRWQLIRQLVIESCLLSLFGALLGLVIATWISNGLVHYASANEIADGLSSSLSAPVLLFAAGIALVSGVVFGVAPAWRATRVELVSTLKGQSGGLASGLSHANMRKGLVISQVALTLVLVTVAGGFVRSLYNLKHVDLGLQPSNVLQFAVAPDLNGYNDTRALDFYHRLEERLSALPGVRSLSGVQEPLFSDNDWSSSISVEGEPAELAGTRDVMRNGVGSGHFSNLGIPLLQGREFTSQDSPTSPKVAIVNETMAKTFFPNTSALGRHVKFGRGADPANIEIVGIVQDSHHMDVKEKPQAFVYLPYSQEKKMGGLTYYVRTSQDPVALAGSIRRAVGDLDPSMPVYQERTVVEQIARQLSSDRLVALLATMFGGLAALLAAIGIYGLLAYTVMQRTREIGVRIALGASTQRVRKMILSEVAQLVAIGIAIGLPLAFGLGKVVDSLLYGVKIFEIAGVAAALLILGIVALVAGYVPARRATRIAPMIALRYE